MTDEPNLFLRPRAASGRAAWSVLAALSLASFLAANVAALGGVWAASSASPRAGKALSDAPVEPRLPATPPAPPPTFAPVASADGRTYEQRHGERVYRYTLVPELQKEAETVLSRYDVPYGAFVAVEPKTGRILAMAEYAKDPADRGHLFTAGHPAASLIKIVTASAALDTARITPESVYRFEGSPYKLSARKLSPKNARRENNETTFGQALGKSNNVVFAKVGADVVGPERFSQALYAFGFNRPIPFDFPLEESHALVPAERFELGKTAAGLENAFISPVHAALLAAAVANDGVMMRPYVLEEVDDAAGVPLYRADTPRVYDRTATERVAKLVGEMMRNTVTEGTSRSTLRKSAKKLLSRVARAGKTGTLTGEEPPGRYEWFIGFAPAENPDIAVAGLVVNQGDLWHINGTYAAAAVMKEYFGL